MAKDTIPYIKPSPLTAEELRRQLHYNPENGEFRWLKRGHGRRLSGVAGSKKTDKKDPHWRIQIDKVGYRAHILAWFYMTGEWPFKPTIDHIDTNPFNNRWDNLRCATVAENTQNAGARRSNASGILGAHWNRFRRCWVASIGRPSRYLGSFKTAQEAHEAYKKAALELYGDFAHSSLKTTK